MTKPQKVRHVRRLGSVNDVYRETSYHIEVEDATSRISSYIYLRRAGFLFQPVIRTHPPALYSISPTKLAF